MEALILAFSPFLTNWLTSAAKRSALSDASSAAIRAACAVLSLLIAIGETLLSGTAAPDFSTTLTVAAIAVVNFVGATGVFHIGTRAVATK